MNKILSLLALAFLVSTPLAYAEETTATVVTTPTPVTTSAQPAAKPKPIKSAIDTACMQNAIETRDVSVTTALDTYVTSLKTALSTRKESMKAGWAQQELKGKREAIRAASVKYKSDVSAARKIFVDAKKSTWDKFYTTRKTCGKGVESIDPTSHSADSNL